MYGDSLAALLTALKRRKGRSFDALAARLRLSRSALHRYASGAALPTHFSIVELWARECDATPEEIAELRRLWRLCQSGGPAVDPVPAADAPDPEVALDAAPEPAPVRSFASAIRWPVTRWLVPIALIAATIAFAYDARAGHRDAPRPDTGAAGLDGSTVQLSSCEVHTEVRRVDVRHGGHVWRTEYVCGNRPGVTLYSEPGGRRRVAVIDNPETWIVCWTSGPPGGDGHPSVWYYTRGDRLEAGAERFGGWGYLAAGDVTLDSHPAVPVPHCWFVPAVW